jgi:hypothetical protein
MIWQESNPCFVTQADPHVTPHLLIDPQRRGFGHQYGVTLDHQATSLSKTHLPNSGDILAENLVKTKEQLFPMLYKKKECEHVGRRGSNDQAVQSQKMPNMRKSPY